MGRVTNSVLVVAGQYLTLAAAAVILAGCGGGGGSSATPGNSSQDNPPTSSGGTPPANHAPTISGTPTTIAVVGQAYSFQPSASDADGNALTFSITGKPAWASFNQSTGRLSGTPASGNVGIHSNIRISVSDGTTSAQLPVFSIQVQAAPVSNSPPTISGTPLTSVLAGQSYSFQPSASDINGDTLTFSISNRPSWASFDATTGRLYGTPTSGDVGSYANIRITVSDGAASASLAAFTVTVNQVANGTATISWIPPTQNTDGTPLTDLAGYRIHYGTSPSALNLVVDINNPGLTSYMIQNLTPATWYFRLRAYSSDGVESELSNTASKTIL